MLDRRNFLSCGICAVAGFAATGFAATQALAQGQPAAAPPGPQGIARKILSRTEMPDGKYVAVLVEAEFDPGIKIARHTHPGIESGYLISGGGLLTVEGQPDRTLKAADGFQIPTGVPHAFDTGTEKTRLAITYVVEKDKPLASPAP